MTAEPRPDLWTAPRRDEPTSPRWHSPEFLAEMSQWCRERAPPRRHPRAGQDPVLVGGLAGRDRRGHLLRQAELPGPALRGRPHADVRGDLLPGGPGDRRRPRPRVPADPGPGAGHAGVDRRPVRAVVRRRPGGVAAATRGAGPRRRPRTSRRTPARGGRRGDVRRHPRRAVRRPAGGRPSRAGRGDRRPGPGRPAGRRALGRADARDRAARDDQPQRPALQQRLRAGRRDALLRLRRRHADRAAGAC